VVVKGDPRLDGRRGLEKEKEGHLAGNAKYRRPRDAGRQYTTPN